MEKLTINEEFHKNPIPMIAIAIVLCVLLALVSYTEQKPVIDTKPVAKVDCSNEAVMGRCVLKMEMSE